MEVKIIDGDLLTSGADYICHQVNVNGVMGGGVAYYVKKKWPNVYTEYSKMCKDSFSDPNSLLGEIQTIGIGNGQSVVNVFAENLYGLENSNIPTSYPAFNECMNKISAMVPDGARVAFPFKIASVRGGADWNIIKMMIENNFSDRNVTIEYWRLDKG